MTLFQETSTSSADAKRYGESMALIAGDILSVMGSEAILYSKFPANRKMLAIDVFNRAVINTCIGQALDIRSSMTEVKESDIKKVNELKTAVYTISAPLKIGALLAGAKPSQLKVLKHYALPLGRSFQLKDDILGLYSTKDKIGKPVGSDIREGKKTILLLKTLALASKKDKEFIKKSLGTDLNQKDLLRFKAIVRDTGALEYCEKEARKNARLAQSIIQKSSLNKVGKDFLIELADYIIDRDY